MTLRDLDIDVDVEVNASELKIANEQADQLIRTMRELERTYKIDIDMDGLVQTTSELIAIERKIEEIDGSNMDIHMDLEGLLTANSELWILMEKIGYLDGRDIDVRIDVDSAGAHAQLAAFNAHSALSGKNKSSSAQAPTGLLGNLASNAAGMFSLGGLVKMGALAASVSLLLPPLAAGLHLVVGILGTLGVTLGVVGGGLFSFMSALGVATVGIGGFAAMSISAITGLYDENAKLTKEQKALKKETDSVITSWNNLKTSLQGVTYNAISTGVQGVNTLLSRAEPIINNATTAIDGLLGNMNKSFEGDNMKNFFGYLERAVGPLTSNIGGGLGFTLQGIFNWMVALEPLTSWVGQGFENMMKRFSNWTASLQGSERMTAFMEYVKENLPKVGDIISGMTDGIVGWFEGFDTTASDGLTWMVEKMQDFAEWSSKLDENEGFQKMLQTIREDGPIIASIISNVTSGVTQMIGALSDSGVLTFFDKLTDPKNFNFEAMAENLSIGSLFDTSLERAFSGINFSNLFSNFNPFGNMDASGIFGKVSALNWSDFVPKFSWVGIVGEFAWNMFVDKLNWPSLENFSWSNFVSKFNWPSIELFTWGKFIAKFVWPTIPVFSWSNFVSKLTWPSIPKFSWSDFVGKLGFGGGKKDKGADGSHANGLGYVKRDGYIAELHQGEAVLQASNAQILRDMGVLEGSGENPRINTMPLVSNTSNVKNQSSSSTSKVEIGSLQVIVQGGNTNAETGNAIAEFLDNYFADLNLIMPVNREV